MSNKKILLSAMFTSFLLVSNLFCAKDFYEKMQEHMYFSGAKNSKEERQWARVKIFEAAIKSANEELKKLRDAGKPEDDVEVAFYTNILADATGLKKIFFQNVNNRNTDRRVGVFLAKLFAGPDRAGNIDEDEIAGIGSGLLQGLAIPAGRVMSSRAEQTINAYVGSTWDFLFAKLGDFFNMVRNALFHSNKEPFDKDKLDGWQKIIMCAYDDINNMLTNVLRDSTRSLDSVARQFDDEKSDEQPKKEIDMWASLVAGYAEQFNFFIKIFETHAEYYDSDDIVVFYSNQICQMLQITCKLLLSSRSLKDLDSKLESQKAIIPAIKKNIFNLFEQLKFEVQPKSYSMKSNLSGPTTAYKPSSYNSYQGSGYGSGYGAGYGSDMPTSYSQYGGM